MSGRVNAKSLQENQENLGFAPSVAKSEMGKRLEDMGPTCKMTEQNA